MAEEVIAAVKEKLLFAEAIHAKKNKELDSLERVIGMLRKLRRARETKSQQFEDTGPLETLIQECSTQLERTLAQHEGDQSYEDVNFDEWIDTVENDIRAQDHMMFSFASGSSGDEGENNLQHRRSTRSRGREGSVSSKGGSTMLDILKSNGRMKVKHDGEMDFSGKDDRFFCLTTSAWALAVIGMMITIGFLTGDFLAARRDVAIRIERTAPTALELPAVTFCGDIPNVPTFFDYPTKEYPGLPLFGVTSYVELKRAETVPVKEMHYPNTTTGRPSSPIKEVVVAADGKSFQQAPRGFDVMREISSLHMIQRTGSFAEVHENRSMGLHCFRIGYPEKIELQPFITNISTGVSVPAVQLQLFKSRMLGACRTAFLRRDASVQAAFSSELHLYAPQLVERGILDFNGSDHSILLDAQLLLGTAFSFDFYCNVYFFSGFFYPSLDGADIAYRYNKTHGRWDETGEGPYYSAFSWARGAPEVSGPSLQVLQKDTYGLDSIRIYVEEAAKANSSGYVSPATGVSILDSSQSAIYTFKRVNVANENEYEVKEGLSQDDRRTFFVSRFLVNMDFSTFETEKVLTTPTMSWPEFITDVFEFVGLFTGICIFTLIVAPAHSLV